MRPARLRTSSFRLTALAAAVAAVSLLPAGGALAGPGPGQQSGQEPRQVEEILVTGSNIRRNRDFDTPSPIQTLGYEAIEEAGASHVQDLFRTLTVNAGSELATSQNARMGQSQFSLRGLGVSGTLTLINGRRAGVSPIATGDGSFYTDANQYPVNMIERVEVLTDGASATYGSEAVGGVVNLITRNNFDGFEFGGEIREYSEHTGRLMNAALGAPFDGGHFAMFVNYYEQDGVFRGDFDWLRERDNNGNGQLGTGSNWDSGTGAGRYQFASQNENGDWRRSGNTVADTHCGQPNPIGVVNTFAASDNCRYSFIDQRRLVPEESRFQFFSTFDYDAQEGIRLFSEVGFSSNEIRDAIGGAVLRETVDHGGFLVPASHPFNYFVRQPGQDGEGMDVYTLVWDPAAVAADPTRAVDVIFRGRPLTTFDGALAEDIIRRFDSTRIMTGADIDLSPNWSLNTSFMYARTQASDRQPRSYNGGTFRDRINDHTWNPFGIAWADPDAVSVKDRTSRAGNSAADLLSFSSNRVFEYESVQKVAEAIVSGDIGETEFGTVTAAFGLQHRSFSFEDIADSLSYFRLDGRGDPVTIITADQDVTAVFAEAIVPLREDVELQAAIRYEDYGDGEGGDSIDPKVGVRWQADDEWLLRASWGTSFQAPTVRQVAGSIGNQALNDRVPTDAVPGGACNDEADGFNAALITEGGDLEPQSARNFNLGAVYQTDSRFTGSVDFFVYDYTDFIQTGEDFQTILDNECRDDVYTPDPRVGRDPSGQLNFVTSSFINVGEVHASGFDIRLAQEWDVAGGILRLHSDTTYITEFDIDDDGDGSFFDGAGNRNRHIGFGSLPALRSNLGMTWRNDMHNIAVTARHISDYDDRIPGSSGYDDSLNAIDYYTVVDFQYGIRFNGLIGGGETGFVVGINNLNNQDPPEVASDRIAHDGEVHDPRGRTFYFRFRQSF